MGTVGNLGMIQIGVGDDNGASISSTTLEIGPSRSPTDTEGIDGSSRGVGVSRSGVRPSISPSAPTAVFGRCTPLVSCRTFPQHPRYFGRFGGHPGDRSLRTC